MMSKRIKTTPAGFILFGRRMLYPETKKAPMRYLRTVWVVDIDAYLTYIEQGLEHVANLYPWLRYTTPINRSWDWSEVVRANDSKSQRDHLIDWIVRQEIHEAFYLHASNHHYNPDFEEIYQRLRSNTELSFRTHHDIFIPKIYGDIHVGRIYRHSCWLYLECEVENISHNQHVLSAHTTRNPSKHLR